VRLSRFAALRPEAGLLVLEVPGTPFRAVLHQPLTRMLVTALTAAGSVRALAASAGVAAPVAAEILSFLVAAGVLLVGDIQAVLTADVPLTAPLERDHHCPKPGVGDLTAEQLGELLYRAARIRSTGPARLPALVSGPTHEASQRPYSNIGSFYELEVFVTLGRCSGLPRGHITTTRWHTRSPSEDDAERVERLLDVGRIGAGSARTPAVPSDAGGGRPARHAVARRGRAGRVCGRRRACSLTCVSVIHATRCVPSADGRRLRAAESEGERVSTAPDGARTVPTAIDVGINSTTRTDTVAAVWRLPPRRAAGLVLVLVLTGYGVLAIVGVIFATASPIQAVISCLMVGALVVLQAGYLSRPDRPPRPPWSYVALVVQAALVFPPVALFGPIWHGFPGFLAASALLVLPTVAGVLAFVLVIVTIAVISVADTPMTEDLDLMTAEVYVVASATASGLAVFGLSTLVRLLHEAHDAREKLRQAAVARERVRLARDVHDVLGQGLSRIVLRSELIARLLRNQPAQARRELAKVLELARKALADVRTVVGIRREVERARPERAPGPPEGGIVPSLGWPLLGGVLICLSLVLVVGIAQERGWVAAAALAAIRLALILLLLAVSGMDSTAPRRFRVGMLVLMAVLALAPQPLLGPFSRGSEIFVGGAALLLLRPLPGLVVAAVMCLVSVGVELVAPAQLSTVAYSVSYTLVGAVLVTMLIYGLGTVPRLIAQLREARDELADAAAAAERMRVARDVHDLLGLGLATIVKKCELADKLLERAPERAGAEVAEVLVAARRALGDVHSAVGGNRNLSLEEEWRSVLATLEAAEVHVRATQEGEPPDGPAGTVIATVLREGATNVLRHSSASWCSISIRRTRGLVVLEIINNGVRQPQADASARVGPGGNGLRNIADRVRAVGGELDTAPDGECYRLRVQVPLPA
jgi:signal transduction histidine kinase